MDEFYDAIKRLPAYLHKELEMVVPQQAGEIQEIHLRSERPLIVTKQNEQLPLSKIIPGIKDNVLTHAQLKECFLSLCDHSVHSYETQLAQGFFTLPRGHRVGVAGIFQVENMCLRGIQTITSLNIRISRIKNIALPVEVQQCFMEKNSSVLLIGTPGCGKTTLLRTISSYLSDLGRKVTVIDERMEIWPCGVFGFAAKVPVNCDVISGTKKSDGIHNALRSLAPQVILCDEIGSQDDLQAIKDAQKAGVSLVCSLHGKEISCALERFVTKKDGLTNIFSYAILFKGEEWPGYIQEVRKI